MKKRGRPITVCTPYRSFSLTELLVVFSILMLLVSLLRPYLNHVLVSHYNLSCQKNLADLGKHAELFAGDHDNSIPCNGISYNKSPEDGIPQDHDENAKGPYVFYTGDKKYNHIDYGYWYSKGNLGDYVFNGEATNNYQDHEIYACPASSMTVDTDGNEVKYLFSYWSNINDPDHGGPKSAPWKDNSNISDAKPFSFTNLSEIKSPSTLMSIADVAQNQVGTVDQSGAFNLAPHFYDNVHTPDPVPGPDPKYPNARIGPLLSESQNGRASKRGIFDFRHRSGMNSLFFDGHVENMINGSLINKNIYRQ